MLEIVLAIIAVLSIIGISIYFYMDMDTHKKSNKTDFEQVDKNLGIEKEDRLANLKFIVDQVNKTNEDMDTVYNKKFQEHAGTLQEQQAQIEQNLAKYNDFESGFGTIIRVSQETVGATGNKMVSIPLSSLATVPITNVDLMKHVSALGGITIKDLTNSKETPTKRVKICGAGDLPTCMELPNDEGDVYITSLVKDRSVVLDGMVKTKGTLKTYGLHELYAPNSDMPTATFGVTAGEPLPNALSITAPNGVAIYTSQNTPALMINRDNTVSINGDVMINGTKVSSALAFPSSTLPTTAPTTTLPTTPMEPTLTTTIPTYVPPTTAPTTTPTTTLPPPSTNADYYTPPMTTLPSETSTLILPEITPEPTTVPEPSATIMEAGCPLTEDVNYFCDDPASPLFDKNYLISGGKRNPYTNSAWVSRGLEVAPENDMKNCMPLEQCPEGVTISA